MEIKSVKYISTVTGDGITDKWDVYGTDLGIPVYDSTNKRMYFLFGDTEGESEIDKTTSNSSLKCLTNLFAFLLFQYLQPFCMLKSIKSLASCIAKIFGQNQHL